MSLTDDLVPVLKRLKLSGVLQTLELRTKQAIDEDLSHSEFLYRLLHDEVDRREAKQLDQRLRKARFEQSKAIEDFDFHFNPSVPKARVLDLATCAFVDRHENVLLVGPTGVGKSHLAQALGQRACRAGFDVLYVTAADLFKQLRAARADESHERRLQRFVAPDLLIIDDIGLRPLRHDEPVDLYDVIRLRYERGSIVFTSNRALDELSALFADPLLATAAMDRLLHHSHVLVLEGDSFRNPPSDRRRRLHGDASAHEAA